MAPKINQEIESFDGVVVKAWTAPSSTDHGTKHITLAIADAAGDISFTCSCKGMQYSGTCWHTDQARENLD